MSDPIDRLADASQHIPVMPEEVLAGLRPAPGQVILDGTLGGGGHTRLLLPRVLPGGRIIAMDRDPVAIARGRADFADQPVSIVHGNFCDADQRIATGGPLRLDGVLLDLGMSSDQLYAPQRGFSFQQDSELDMRFDPTQGQPAWQLLSHGSERELADLIYKYGEERHSRRIARAIVARRRTSPIKTTQELADVVRRCVRGRQKIDAATRTFQALRIAINDELASLQAFLQRVPEWLADGGRVAIISFHSLEDRLVKHAFREMAEFEMITRKPIRPTEDEVHRNRRARSARLRVAARRPRHAIDLIAG